MSQSRYQDLCKSLAEARTIKIPISAEQLASLVKDA